MLANLFAYAVFFSFFALLLMLALDVQERIQKLEEKDIYTWFAQLICFFVFVFSIVCILGGFYMAMQNVYLVDELKGFFN